VAGVVLILIVSLLGLIFGTWMVSEEKAKTQAAQLQGEKDRAAEARRAVDLLIAVSEDELADNPQFEAVRIRLLETALEYYQGFIDKYGTDIPGQADLEAGQNRLRSILDELATLKAAKMIDLARDSGVQKDMRLTKNQRDQIGALHKRSVEQRNAKLEESRALKPEARRKIMYDLAKSQQLALAEILKDKLPRLKQIDLQAQGPQAFESHTYVAGALKLTAEQRQRIREFHEKAIERVHRLPKGLDFAVWEGQMNQIRSDEMAGIMSALTTEQRARWDELTGTAFEGKLRGPKGPKKN